LRFIVYLIGGGENLLVRSPRRSRDQSVAKWFIKILDP
jgi:hypothetical protein